MGMDYYFFFFSFICKHSVSFEKLPKQNSNSLVLSLCIYDYNKHTHISFSKFYSIVKLSSRISSGDSSIFKSHSSIALKLAAAHLICSLSSSNQPPEKLRSSSGHELPPHTNTQPHSHPLVLFSLVFKSGETQEEPASSSGGTIRVPAAPIAAVMMVFDSDVRRQQVLSLYRTCTYSKSEQIVLW
ncbi:hypothetical protein Hanom_Chr12g01157041 [Helianthus anomalus]